MIDDVGRDRGFWIKADTLLPGRAVHLLALFQVCNQSFGVDEARLVVALLAQDGGVHGRAVSLDVHP